jgi:hypothetical protein
VLAATVFKRIALHFRIAIVRVWIEAGLQLSELDRELDVLRAKNGSAAIGNNLAWPRA